MKTFTGIISLLISTLLLLSALCACRPGTEISGTTSFPQSEPTDTDTDTDTETDADTSAQTDAQSETEQSEAALPTPPAVTQTGEEQTEKPHRLICKSVQQFTEFETADIMLYAEVEENATVYVCDHNGNVLTSEKAIGPCWYGVLPLGEDEKKVVYVYAQAEGKALSSFSFIRLKHTDTVGVNTFIGKNSRLYLNWYDAHYYGYVTAEAGVMGAVRAQLMTQLKAVREKTGKATKMIFLIATNPATIYHDMQYEQPFGRGDSYSQTTTTQFVDYMKGDDDIYVVDCRTQLYNNRGQFIFYQTDTHWTQLGAYYCYAEMMKYVEKDFPCAITYQLKNYNIDYDWRCGDLIADTFSGGAALGMREYAPYLTAKSSRTYAPDCPTAYIVGDSDMGAMNLFLNDTFKACYYNTDGTNPPLYTYHFDELSTRQPDYLVFVFTERNIDSALSQLWIENTITDD